MDICVLTEKGNAHGGFLLRARPVGGLRMLDGDEADDKVLAVLENDLVFGAMEDVAQVPGGLVDRLRHYFLSYKQIPGAGPRKVQIAEVYDREVQHSIKRFLAVLEPVLILSLAVMIGGIVFSILLGVMGMSELVA